MNLTRTFGTGVAVAAVVAAGAVLLLPGDRGAAREVDPVDDARATATAAVERRDLERTETLRGQLGYGEAWTLGLAEPRAGTVTWLAAEGETIERGGVAARIDEIPIALLVGDIPIYRPLAVGVPKGEDVRQLEEQLVALGYADRSETMPDDRFTGATSTALRAWQRDVGMSVDGRLDPSDVVVASGAVRVADRTAVAGRGAPDGALLEVTATAHVVTIDADPVDARWFTEGGAVTVELPDGRTAPGTVSRVATTLQTLADQQGNPRYVRQVAIVLDESDAFADVAVSPVDVDVAIVSARDVLAVPVHALLATSPDRYIVERVSSGTAEPVAVEVGTVVDGWAEVTGDLAEGDVIVVPR